ncbi:hypothetical protein C7477_1515 [Phyllobacterium leguminum]|uniref:MobB protein n=1 Tax=Phyllobacterium leguminum TaxID=314237 RepID=A0A318T718_9HYPH|nr:hypothetical protein C7477_1515 [Phyllobacterium leguminum]
MSRGGPTSSTLSERLSAKLEADRKQIEELTLSEHRKLAQSFLAASRDELATIKNAIHEQSLSTMQNMRVMLRWPLWTAAGCIVIVLTSLALLLVGTWWMRQDLAETRRAIIGERQALSSLRAQTGGVKVTTSDKGTFLVLPKGAETGWTCDETPCVKIPATE